MVCLIYYLFNNNLNYIILFFTYTLLWIAEDEIKGDPVSVTDAYRHTKTKGHDGVTWLSEKDKKMAVSLCRINLQLIFTYTFILYIYNVYI